MRRAFLLSVPLALFCAACTYDNGDAQRLVFDPQTSGVQCGTQATSTIDVGAQVDVDAGQGAGVYVEYATGGHWHLRTSCDTDKSNTSCAWDVLVYPTDSTNALSNFVPENLESGDSLHPYADTSDTYQLNATTTTDLDGFTFDGNPGGAVTVDALLDGTCAVDYFFWVGNGALHSGSPSNPLNLVPSSD
jgi:hypothetical protein